MTHPAHTTEPPDLTALHDATSRAANILTAPARRRAALTYLAQRGIATDALPEHWPLGYAPPGWTRLIDTLGRDFPSQVLLDAGLARRSSRGTLIDTFRDRVIFPNHDNDGQIVGFTGRDLSGTPGAPKYLNSPATALFRKGELLYGLHEAGTLTPRPIRPILVEGPIDVLALTVRARLSGDTDLMPVASCGTALTPAQTHLISDAANKYDLPVVVAMDGDAVGRTAACTSGERLRSHGLDVTVAILPAGADPADYAADPRRNLDPFRHSNAIPLLTIQVERIIATQGERMQWVEGRVNAARTVARLLATYPSGHARSQIPWISTALDIAPTTFAAELESALDVTRTPASPSRTAGEALSAVTRTSIGTVSPSLGVAR